jgi:Tol biopolymer transport system component
LDLDVHKGIVIMKNFNLIGLICCFCLVHIHCQNQAPPQQLAGPYLGQTPPGTTPVLFAAGIVSTEIDELNATFSADGRELYFSRRVNGRNSVMVTREETGSWSDATVAPFSGVYGDVDPFLASDGLRLYFSSRRPIESTGPSKDADLWYVERSPGGEWGNPIRVAGVNVAEENDYYTSIAEDGTLYFSRFDSEGVGDLYRSSFEGDGFGEPAPVGGLVNSVLNEHDPFIAADGSYLIFSSNRAGGFGENDLYISFRDDDGSWLEPRNMGVEINSPGYDYCPNVSHDGKYLFFTREINNNGDIYWVDAQVISQLRH